MLFVYERILVVFCRHADMHVEFMYGLATSIRTFTIMQLCMSSDTWMVISIENIEMFDGKCKNWTDRKFTSMFRRVMACNSIALVNKNALYHTC